METGIYLRVSTEEQAQEGFSIRGQEQKLKEYSHIKDWSIYKIYADEGISGKNIAERPAMNELVADIKAGKVKNVLVYKIDRLTRSTADLLYLVELFNEYDCAFNSLMESIDTQTPSGRMFLKIIGIFAEFERENIIERVKLGLERKVNEGYSLASQASYGYDKPKGQKIQTTNQKEAEIVREIFALFVYQGLSLHGIAKILNLRGIPTKQGGIWYNRTVKGALENCNYIGKVRHHVGDKEREYITEGLHEPIISEELFEEAQKLLAKHAKTSPTKQPKENSYFSGLLYCPKCKTKFSTHAVEATNNYVCPMKQLGTCNASAMSHKKLEKAFYEYIERINPFSEVDKLELQRQEQEKLQTYQLVLAYQDKLRLLERKEKEIMQLYVNDNIDFDTYRDMKKKIEEDRATIQAEIARLDVPEEKEPEINKEDVIADLKQNWEALTNSERRQFLVRYIKRLYAVNEVPEGKKHGTVRVTAVEFNCE